MTAAVTNESHRHGHQPKPHEANLAPPLAQLWAVEKSGELRAAAIYPHAMGVELRVVDRAGLFVFTRVFPSEAEAVNDAATRHDGYKAHDWTDVEG